MSGDKVRFDFLVGETGYKPGPPVVYFSGYPPLEGENHIQYLERVKPLILAGPPKFVTRKWWQFWRRK